MKVIGLGAILMGCSLVGCGGAEPLGGFSASTPQSVMYSGMTDQGLAVSVQEFAKVGVVLAWQASCSDGLQVHPHPLREARFILDGVPGRFSGGTLEPGDDLSHERLARSIDLRRDGGVITGHFRIRSRWWNGEDSIVTTLCDTGQVGFRVKRVTLPEPQPITVSRSDVHAADFQEQITIALERVDQAVNRSDTVVFCGALTARLRRTACRTRKAALDLMGELDISLTDVEPAKRAGRAAVVIVPTGSYQSDDGVESRDVRTLRFVPPPTRADGPWRLDRIGPLRLQPHG